MQPPQPQRPPLRGWKQRWQYQKQRIRTSGDGKFGPQKYAPPASLSLWGQRWTGITRHDPSGFFVASQCRFSSTFRTLPVSRSVPATSSPTIRPEIESWLADFQLRLCQQLETADAG